MESRWRGPEPGMKLEPLESILERAAQTEEAQEKHARLQMVAVEEGRDVVVVCKDRQYYLHSKIIADQNGFGSFMTTMMSLKDESDRVIISDPAPDAIDDMIKFTYTKQYPLPALRVADPKRSLMSDKLALMTFHLRNMALAEQYLLWDLGQAARAKFQEIANIIGSNPHEIKKFGEKSKWLDTVIQNRVEYLDPEVMSWIRACSQATTAK